MSRRAARTVGAFTLAVVAVVVLLLLFWVDPNDTTSDTTSDTASDTATTSDTGASSDSSRRLKVLSTLPHGDRPFTQGLVFTGDGRLFESGGRYGDSELAEVDPETGRVVARVELPEEVFAEGLAAGPDGLVQLTWQEGRAFRWALDLGAIGEWAYPGQGWGLTYDPRDDQFLRSDGSATIFRHDRATFAVTGQFTVTRDGVPVTQLNELELVGEQLYANVWKTSEIVRIDPDTGEVTATIDASIIDPDLENPESVLNGIAHRPGDPPNRLWLTGKNWPHLFEVDVVAR